MYSSTLIRSLALGAVLLAAGCSASQETAVVAERAPRPEPIPSTETPAEAEAPEAAPLDTVTAGRFDGGKMWTFDNPPLAYFEEAYNFRPDSSWFRRARLGALRLPNCTASFVSPRGLVMTNHHCARESVVQVSEEGENLLDNGFYAETLEEERRVEDLYVDQLIQIEDVTERVASAARGERTAEAQAQARASRLEQLEAELTTQAKERDTTYTVQVIELYNGGQYSAYTFRRFHDVRLVMAPELALGQFGGDPDNFTYPRYSLDMSFLRVYEDGEPYEPEVFFPWSIKGASEGDVVFLVGNPGSTSRLSTVSQLEFERDYTLPEQLRVLNERARILNNYIEANPDAEEADEVRNTYFSVRNTIKALEGQLGGLEDGYLIARRGVSERSLSDALQGTDSLSTLYGGLFGEISDLQLAKEAAAEQAAAFTFFASPPYDSPILTRALYGWIINILRQRGAPPDVMQEYREDALEVESLPREVEAALIAARMRELQRGLGADNRVLRQVLDGRTPEAYGEAIASETALADSARYAEIIDKGYLSSGDPTVPFTEAVAPLFFAFAQQLNNLQQNEQTLNARLALARFAVSGTEAPPDATFSLRLADGIVKGYPYNGTIAPPHTTMYGLFSHYYAYGEDSEWTLPQRWLDRAAELDLTTPVNFVSTNDITGGNSGSPVLNRNLEVVGLAFDSNIEGLPNEYLYTGRAARTVSVDARGMLEALRAVYDADRLVEELASGVAATGDGEAGD